MSTRDDSWSVWLFVGCEVLDSRRSRRATCSRLDVYGASLVLSGPRDADEAFFFFFRYYFQECLLVTDVFTRGIMAVRDPTTFRELAMSV